MNWEQLGSRDPRELTDARLQCHHAVQLLTRVARGYLPAKEDDSHTAFAWNAAERRFEGLPVETSAGPFRVALDVAELRLCLLGADGELEAALAMDGKPLAEAEAWLRERLISKGLDPDPFSKPLHFEIPEHAVASGAAFSLGDAESFREMARYYGNGGVVVRELVAREPGASEIRVWPHHFDLATLIQVAEGKTIGVGLAPGDDSYDQPYFYAAPWPPPDASQLTGSPGEGHWHTEGWTGAALTAGRIVAAAAADAQQAMVRTFIDESERMFRALLTDSQPEATRPASSSG